MLHENWREDHIKLLINENATSRNILDALDWLASISDSNDIIFFSFFGHGSELPDDDDGDEDDGYDEAIVPWECTKESCITDDVLGEKLDKIKALGMALLFDCCLSGEFLESKSENVREKFISYQKINSYQKGLTTDVGEKGRVILTSAYGDGLSLCMRWVGSPCSIAVALALKNGIDSSEDGICSAEEIFLFSRYSVNFFWLIGFPLFWAILEGILTGPIGFIYGFTATYLAYLILEIKAILEKGHWILPFPQIYDGFEGDLPLAYADR